MRAYTAIPVSLLFAAVLAQAAPRIDNVLIRMVPPGATSLVGAHMDELTASELYQKLMARQSFPQLDQFARETGFDPRHDVRELLSVSGPQGTVVLARGKFNLKQEPLPGMTVVRHGEYSIHTLPPSSSGAAGATSGYTILDPTLAAAGDLSAVEAALDEWRHGTHKAAQPLLARVASLNGDTTLWGVSTGFARFLANYLPRASNGIDFAAIFQGIESSWFSANVTSGLIAEIHCTTANEKDAANLRDTAKGLIGLGRLSVPQNQPDLLRFWDGLTVDQAGAEFSLNANIPGDLIDQMVQLFSAQTGRGRGARGGGGRTGGAAGPGGGTAPR